jgi:cytochrome c oxidase cbb3-type subunit 2
MHLWTNAILHVFAALLSAWLLRSRGLTLVLGAAFVVLGSACMLLLSSTGAQAASVLYPVGVSLYSVALVAYPSFLAPAATAGERARQAGWIYAVAGWGASVMGIGMAQNLGHIPPAFVGAAGLVILLPVLVRLFLRRQREVALTAAVFLAGLILNHFLSSASEPHQSQIERGRQVYISEGCISCHSQYVRPNSPDVLMWGPVESTEEIRRQHPPLIGNRRQGPDLSNVGERRSALWLKMHFYNPAAVSGASIMPAYAFLFDDRRGDDLVAYLESLHGAGVQQHIAQEQAWQPSQAVIAGANAAEGQRLYARYCSTCHSADGRTRTGWYSSFKHLPRGLGHDLLQDVPASATRSQRLIRLAQIAKFGIPGTDMPGHEYLPDQQITSMSLWVLESVDGGTQKP